LSAASRFARADSLAGSSPLGGVGALARSMGAIGNTLQIRLDPIRLTVIGQ